MRILIAAAALILAGGTFLAKAPGPSVFNALLAADATKSELAPAPPVLAPAEPAAWTTGPRPVVWKTQWKVGDGVDRVAEKSTAEQGGDPPALAHEPKDIETVDANYRPDAWVVPGGTRIDEGEAKFRITCNVSGFGLFDPIIYPGQENMGHHHTFFGNKWPSPNSSYLNLRNHPSSSCSGGPLNATLYWEPSLIFEMAPGKSVPVRANVVSFYYQEDYGRTSQLYRLLNGFAFIGGVDPADRLNAARLKEIPNGRGWDKTLRYNGWLGWMCMSKAGSNVPLSPANTADASSPLMARQLVNADGSDPWGGACEGADKTLIATVDAPDCWDGYNLHSPDGRGHMRYSIRQSDNSVTRACPDGWWRVPTFVAKVEFANGTPSLSGHAWRTRLHLSSDRMDPDPGKWQPNGSTFHFDWMNGWSRKTMNTWLKWCLGVTIDGDPGQPQTCGDSTISPSQKMLSTAPSPDKRFSNDPVVSLSSYAGSPEQLFGQAIPASAPAAESHPHTAH